MTNDGLGSRIGETWFGLGLTPGLAERLVAFARDYEAPARTRLLREGDTSLELGVVESGRVALTEVVPARGPLTLMTVEEGDVFGWSAIVEPFTAISTVTALEPVRIIAFDGPRLRDAMEKDHELAAYVRAKLLQALARRLKATRHQLLDVYGAGLVEPVY